MTKVERRKFYWDAYFCCENSEIFIDRECYGISGVCDILQALLNVPDRNLGTLNAQKKFPEFFAQKPQFDLQFYWWSNDIEGWKMRQKPLLKAIQLTYN